MLRETFHPTVDSTILPHLLLIGMGELAEQLILHSAQDWCPYYQGSGCPLQISIVDPEVKQKLNSLKLRYPIVGIVCRINPYPFRSDGPEFQEMAFLHEQMTENHITHVYICLDDASLGLQAGFVLMHALQNQGVQIMVRMTEDTGLAEFLRGIQGSGSAFANLNAFGLLDRTCRLSFIEGGTHEALARVIHTDYLKNCQEDPLAANQMSLEPWEKLPDDLRQSNLAQADHLGVKLNALGYGITPWKDYLPESFSFTDNEVEQLAQMEHDRWCQERLSQGWSYHPTRSREKKHHPDLLPWDDARLTEDAREKNRRASRLLPTLIMKAGFQIYRRKTQASL